MIACGDRNSDWWVQQALKFLPSDLQEYAEDKLVFVSTRISDAFRLAGSHIEEKREVIVLSGLIFPDDTPKTILRHPDARYFFFCVLHEVVHALQNHKPPNEIEKSENDQQENEANISARTWFNNHIANENERLKKIPGSPLLEPITEDEIRSAQDKINELKRSIRKGEL